MKELVGCAAVLAGLLAIGGLVGVLPRARAAVTTVSVPASIDQIDWIHQIQQQGNAPKVDTSARQRQITVRNNDQAHPNGRH